MTKDKAIDVLLNEIACVNLQDTCDHKCGDCDLAMTDSDILWAYDTAIDALGNEAEEYQTPKKVIYHEKAMYYTCPSCLNSLGMTCEYNYCPNCGQLLDWSNFYGEVTVTE